LSDRAPDSPDPAARRGLIYSVCGASVCAVIDDKQLLDACCQLYGAQPLRSGPCKPAAVWLETAPCGYCVTLNGTQPVDCGSRTDAFVALEHAVTLALLESCRHLTHLHAAGAVVGGGAVIALGGSGAGKSSLALAWTLAGHPALGDDIVLLDGGGLVRPFPRHFKLDPEVLRCSGVDPECTPFWNPATREAWFTPAGASGWAGPTSIALVLLCRRSAGERFAIDRLSRLEGVNAMLHSVLDSGLDAAGSVQSIVDATTDAEVLEVRFASSREAAQAIAALLS